MMCSTLLRFQVSPQLIVSRFAKHVDHHMGPQYHGVEWVLQIVSNDRHHIVSRSHGLAISRIPTLSSRCAAICTPSEAMTAKSGNWYKLIAGASTSRMFPNAAVFNSSVGARLT